MDDFYCEQVLSKKVAIEKVMETEEVLAYHHTKPFWPVHIVVIPKQHIPSLTNLAGHDMRIVHHVLEVVTQIARQVEAEYGACRVLTNLGDYQDSKHLHFHVNFGEPLTG